MKLYKPIYSSLLGFTLILTGCSGDGSSGLGDVSTNFPYLLSTPQVSYIQSVGSLSEYDVTVTLEADGPDGVYSVGLWIFSKIDNSEFEYLDLQYVGGTTWSGSTYSLLPMPAGNYYIDSIMIEDGDAFAGGLVKSGWYNVSFFSPGYYDIEQDLTNWDPLNFQILDLNFGISNIPVVNFTLP